MAPELLEARTGAFARRIVTLCLPMLEDARTRDVARELLRSGTAANANYGSAQRGRSHDEFTFRLGQACDDIAEAREWIDLLQGVRILPAEEIETLRNEAEELRKILTSAYLTARDPGERSTPPGDNPIER